MVTIQRESDYAARILLYLALQPPGTYLTAREMARLRLMPSALTRRVVTRLATAGFLRSRRGKGGGFCLARAPSEISLLEAVEVIDGPLALNRCTVEPEDCLWSPQCPVHEVWMEARTLLRHYLNGVTFDQLAHRSQQIVERLSEASRLPA